MRKLGCALFLLSLASVAVADSELEGLASWYGGKFDGRLTSSGEVFDADALTAAHRTLPFGTLVRVTNVENGRTAVVRVNDRGPFVEGRVIDLSRAAAQQLDMLGQGVARVTLEILEFASAGEVFAIQVGAYGLERNARAARAALEQAGFIVTTELTTMGLTRVVVRAIPASSLPQVRVKLESMGFNGYLVRKEKSEPSASVVPEPAPP
jgi:rare lipoprotein A